MKINKNIDILKFVMAFGILWLHILDNVVIGSYLANQLMWKILLQSIVPAFFIISGFFMPRYDDKDFDTKIDKAFMSNLKLLIIGEIIYSVLCIMFGYIYFQRFLFDIDSVLVGNHLWFLVSILFAIYIYKKMHTEKRIKIVIASSFAILSIVYISELVLGFGIKDSYLLIILLYNVVYASCLLFSGIYIRNFNIDYLKDNRIILLILAFAVSMVLGYLEYIRVGSFMRCRAEEIPSAIMLFIFILYLPQINISDKLSFNLRKFSTSLYICHYGFTMGFAKLAKDGTINIPSYIFICVVCSIIAALIFQKLYKFK